MSGDLDYDKTIALIEAYFGEWEPNENLPLWTKVDEPPLVTPFETEIYGPQEERVSIGFRFDGNHTEEFKKIVLIDMLLNNSSAGLIDLNLMQPQRYLCKILYNFFVRLLYHLHLEYEKQNEFADYS